MQNISLPHHCWKKQKQNSLQFILSSQVLIEINIFLKRKNILRTKKSKTQTGGLKEKRKKN